MEILDWRSRVAIHIAADAFIPLRRGPRAPGRQRITLVGAASTLVEDQALVIAFAFASPVAKNELYHAFHAANPSTIMPVFYGRNDAPTADDWKSEPLQFPIIPPLSGNITLRFHGRLYDGPTVRMIQDVAAVRRYPVLPQFDINDPTGCFVPGRAMTEREYQTHDTAMLSLIKIGFEQRKTGPTTEKKAELSGWSDVTAIDSTLCFWATHEAVRIMKKHHMENFDTWESTLRDHIYRIQLHRNVRVTVFLESINKAQLLLDDLGASRVDDATVYNLVVSQYLKLYLKINPRTDTDLLTMQYHKRAVIYRQRYDQTEPLDATDVEEHRRTGRHRTVAFMRDWKNLDAIKQAAKRDEELCTDEASSLPKYLAEYDIESQQPRSGHAKPKVAHVKITETGEVESALSLMSDILDGSPSDDVADAVSQIQHELLANVSSGPPQSLRGGPGGNRRFAMAPAGARPGPPTSRLGANSLGARANRPYYDGMHPSVRGGGNSSNSTNSFRSNSNDKQLRMADVASKLRSSSSPPAQNARPDAMRARQQQQNRRPTDTRPPTSLMQELRRKNELVNRFQSEALELASSGSASTEKMASIEQKMRKAVEIQQEIMVAAAGDYTDDEGYQTADDGDIDDADRDADRAAHVLSTLIDDRIPADEIDEKLSRLSCLAISLDALDRTEHCEVVLNLVNEMCVLMDTCATRSIQGDFKNIVWSKKLRVPVSVAQGSQDAEASAEYIGVRETFHVVPGTNIAMGKQDLTLISTSFRKGLYIEGMTPTYNRGLGTGPTCDYLYNMNAHDPQKNYNDAPPEFKAQSVPLKKLRNGLP
jgi:hypothetical protein